MAASTGPEEGDVEGVVRETSQALLEQCGRMVRLKRQQLGLTQEQVGGRIGLSGNTISQLERGYAWPLMNHLIAIVTFLALPWSLLLPDDPEAPSTQLLRGFVLCPAPEQASILTIVQAMAKTQAPTLLDAASA